MISRLNLLIALAITTALSGCDTGFKEKNGTLVYVTWDEGFGRREHPLPGSDPNTLVALRKESYAKDKTNAYFHYVKIEGVDPTTFVALSDNYAMDSQHVYYEFHLVKDADPKSFTQIATQWGKDKNDIYISDTALNACDPTSFSFLEEDWQRDSKCVYKRGKKLENANPQRFEILSREFAKDDKQVYSYLGVVLEGADPVTFKLWSGSCSECGQDKNHCYGPRKKAVDCAGIK